jgi:hypothetical protein
MTMNTVIECGCAGVEVVPQTLEQAAELIFRAAILPDFLLKGESDIEAVMRLATDYKRLLGILELNNRDLKQHAQNLRVAEKNHEYPSQELFEQNPDKFDALNVAMTRGMNRAFGLAAADTEHVAKIQEERQI